MSEEKDDKKKAAPKRKKKAASGPKKARKAASGSKKKTTSGRQNANKAAKEEQVELLADDVEVQSTQEAEPSQGEEASASLLDADAESVAPEVVEADLEVAGDALADEAEVVPEVVVEGPPIDGPGDEARQAEDNFGGRDTAEEEGVEHGLVGRGGATAPEAEKAHVDEPQERDEAAERWAAESVEHDLAEPESALEDDPPWAEVPRPAGNQLVRARDLVQEGRVPEAIAAYREILAENPSHLKAHNNLGVLFDELGQHALAVAHFEEALRVEPENGEVLTNHGSALTSLGRYDEAEALLRRAVRLAPNDVNARLESAILAFRRGLYAQAEVELGWVCANAPEHGTAHYYRGEALNRMGKFREAEAMLERAAELLPDDPRPVYTLGHLYDRRGAPAEATIMYRRARDLQAP